MKKWDWNLNQVRVCREDSIYGALIIGFFSSIVHFFDTIWDQGFENYFDKIHNKQLDEFGSYP